MPRSLIGQAKPDVPRWRRGTQQAGTGGDGWTRMSRRRARQAGREMGAGLADGLAGGLTGAVLAPGTIPGQPAPAPAGAGRARPWQKPAGVLATGKPYRARYQAAPFAALALALAEAAAAHYATPRPLAAGAVASAVTAALLWRLTRHLTTFARRYAVIIAALTIVTTTTAAAAGPAKWLGAAITAVWGLAVFRPWARHYTWHPGTPEPAAPGIDTTDLATWARLAHIRHWTAWLGAPRPIPGGGGIRYPITCDGADTSIDDIVSQPKKIAGAYRRSTAEAYAERHESGAEHLGWLTLLLKSTLEDIVYWDGRGVDPVTGLARAGRFADGAPGHIQLLSRMAGMHHGILAGASTTGKSEALELLIRIALASAAAGIPIVPVVLDAQEGQSLPEWQEHLIYAAGAAECIKTLRWLHTGMLDRSREMSRAGWADSTGHVHRGMGFYDPDIARIPSLASYTGRPAQEEQLPAILILGDEYPALLTHEDYGDEAVQLTGEVAKMGRKTGFGLWMVSHVPSLSELGDQVLRALLVAFNVICLRTGDSVSAGMLGLPADPSELPKKFPNGKPTYGLGYLIGPDNRQAEFRTDVTPDEVKRTHPPPPPLDSHLAAIRDGWRRDPRTGLLVPPPKPDAPHLTAVPAPAAGPATATEDEGPAGRTADDCILQALKAAWPAALTRGELLAQCAAIATGPGWGRAQAFSVRGITGRLPGLTEAGKIERLDGDDGYRYVRPASAEPPARETVRLVTPDQVTGPGEFTEHDLVMLAATWGLRDPDPAAARERARANGIPAVLIDQAMDLLTNDREHVIAEAVKTLTAAGAPVPPWLAGEATGPGTAGG